MLTRPAYSHGEMENSSSACATVGSATDNELYFAVGVDDNGGNTSISAGNGYILEHAQADSTQHERFYTEDRISAHGSYSTDFTIAALSHWAVIGASFKP